MSPLDPAALPRHAPRLYRAARALCRTREDAEDLVQDTFANVLARPRIVKDESGYLLRTLRNTHVSNHRSAHRRPLTAHLEEETLPSHGEPNTDLLDAIAALPTAYREALIAVDVVGLSYREAAGALGVPEGTVMSRLYRGRRQVAVALG